ncbi:MAG: recombinase zinc beta ribbon domain-containing protein [Burkholderiales bacterium]
MYCDGFGPRVIAKCMNGDPRYRAESRKYFNGQRPPKPAVGKRGSGSWAPTAIRDMLRNPRYRGELVFGRMQTQYDEDGREYRIKQAVKGKIISTIVKDLRTIPEPLWEAAQKRIKGMAAAYMRDEAKNGALKYGKPETGRHSPYLLSGIFACPECGGSLIAHRMSMGAGKTRRLVAHYVCSANNKRGETICKNNARVPQAELDAKLMAYIEDHVLTPERAAAAFKKAVEDGKRRVHKDPGLRAKLDAQMVRLTREKANLTALSAQKLDDPEAVADQINERHREIERIKLELAGLPEARYDENKLEEKKARMLERLRRFRDTAKDRRNIPLLRQFLRLAISIHKLKLVPIVEHERRTYDIGGWAKVSTAPIRRESVASPRGFEPRLPP